MSPYLNFITNKAPIDPPSGMLDVDIPQLSPHLKEFQKSIIVWALRRGRAALFEGTGLGKTIQQLVWARVVADYENAPILVLTPLAVAEQTVAEAAKFDIPGVQYAPDKYSMRGDIVVTNYERFDKFDMSQFAGIVLDESSIIKSADGATRALLTEACRQTPWRLCCTATPAPNDYTEFGQHSEFLGVMDAKEMLAMYFIHDGSIRADADAIGSRDGWRIKGHAQTDFWRWLASWAVVLRHPRDLGFEEDGYDLPPIKMHQITLPDTRPPAPGHFFAPIASTLSERIGARRETISERITAALDIVKKEPDEPWLIWCNLNAEADAVEAALERGLQVAGRHMTDIKVSRLLGFTRGDPLYLISKPAIAGHGMNWQHCARVVFVGLTDSFEQTYQAIRRCWRFGQNKQVHVYFISSQMEGAVVGNLRRKEEAFEAMLDGMVEHVRDIVREQVLSGRRVSEAYDPQCVMELPAWLK